MTSLAIIGGTGTQGKALAARFAKAGVPLFIGSRDAERGAAVAQALNERFGINTVQGMSNRDAARAADVVMLSVPYAGMQPILEDLHDVASGKIVINIASSLNPEKRTRALVHPRGSITAEIQEFFGEGTRVVAAFQHISPEKLESEEEIDSDVLVCGGDRDAREKVIALGRQAGFDMYDAGLLPNAVAIETFTAVLIWMNVKYKVKGAGIRLTSVPRDL